MQFCLMPRSPRKTPPTKAATDPSLLDAGALADAIGRSVWYVYAMKRSGYAMQYGTRTTREHALAWLEAHKGFRTSKVYRKATA